MKIVRSDIMQVMQDVADWQLAHPSEHKSYQWHVAPFWSGLVEFADLSAQRDNYLQAVRANGEANQWLVGPRIAHADDLAIAQSYLQLYLHDKNPIYIAPSINRFNQLLNLPFDDSLEFSSKKTSHEWIWCDALFMAPPALALASQVTGDARYVDLMNRLWWKTSDYLYDKEAQLFFRDSRYFEQREPNGQKVFWSRGNGWVLAGLARVLEYLPPNSPYRARFERQFIDMARTTAKLQSKDGYWRSSLLDPSSMPMPETSGTAFFVYAMAWGINHRVLERAEFEPVVSQGWAALVRSVRADGLLGYVQRVGHRPGETSPDEGEVYGSGAFLLAGVQMYQLAKQ